MNQLARVALYVLVLSWSSVPSAQNSYSVYIDSDDNASTGCAVALPGGTFAGADRRLEALVAPGDNPQVSGIQLSVCDAAVFGPATSVSGGYAVGTNVGVGGADVIELGAARLQVLTSGQKRVRLAFAVEGAGGSDLLVTQNGAANGSPIFLFVPFSIPVLGLGAMFVLGMGVLFLAARMHRHRLATGVLGASLLLVSGAGLAANFMVDGAVGDWAGLGPAASDVVGDSTNSSAALDLVAGFAALEGEQVFFRIDIAELENLPPIMDPAAAATNEDNAVTVTLSGTDPDGQSITFAIATNPANGTLSNLTQLPPDQATVLYTPNPDYFGSDSFTFTGSDGLETSLPGTADITVNAVNDAPTFAAVDPAAVDEDAGAQSVANWATFTAGPANESAQTVLAYSVSNVSNAALFSGAPAVANDGTLSYTPADDQNGSSTFDVLVRDSGGTANGGIDASAVQTFTITVNAVNDPPVLTAGAVLAYTENQAATAIDAAITVVDVDDTNLESATAQITAGFQAGADLLDCPAGCGGLAASFVGDTLTLTGSAALATYEAALRSVTYENSSENPSGTARTVSWIGHDGTVGSTPVTSTINVTAINDPPVNTVPGPQQTADTAALVFNTANGNALSTADPDADTGDIQLVLGVAPGGTLTLGSTTGLVTLTGNGSNAITATGPIAVINNVLQGLIYMPVPGTSAAITLTLTIDDQGNTPAPAESATSLVTINVDAAPVVSISPISGTTIANNAAFTVNFSESVDVVAGMTLTCGGPNLITGGAIGSGVSSLSPTYTAPLPAGACTLTVPATSVTDTDAIDPPNNPAADLVATYTVDAAPALVSSTPVAAVVATNQTISFTYNEPVNDLGGAITLDCGGAIAGAISGSGTATLTFTPSAPLPIGTACTATAVAVNIGDVDSVDPPQNPSTDSTINFSTDAAPTFVSATPAAAALVGTGQTVSFTFDENVDDLGAAITLDCGGAVAGAISGSGTPTLTFTPSTALTPGASCTATAVAAQIGDSDAIDPPQNPVADVVRSFTVDSAPTVLGTTPMDGAIDVSLLGVVSYTFSEPVDFLVGSFTYVCNGNPVAFNIAGGGTATATLTPTANLPTNVPCTVTALATGITDVDAGDPPDNLLADVAISFTTLDDNAPTVTTNPAGGGSNLAVNSNITVTFNEPVTLTGGWFELDCPISGVRSSTGELTGSGITIIENTPDLVYIIDPNTDLANGEQCTITVDSANAVDNDAIDPPDELDGDASGDTTDGDADDYVAVFSTVDVAPTVSSTSPVAAANVPDTQAVTLNFSEAVNVAAGAISFNCGSAVSFTPALPQGNVTTLTLTPSAPLPNGAVCTVALESTLITDFDAVDPPNELDGDGSNDLIDGDADDFTLSFSVDASPAPVSISVAVNGVPTSLPLGVGQLADVNTNIAINFTENVNATVAGVTLECPQGSPVAFAGLPASNTNSLTLNPSSDLPGDTLCRLTLVHTGITDVDIIDPPDQLDGNGDTVAGDSISFDFRTQAVANDDAFAATPHLTLNIPANGVRTNDSPGTAVITGFGSNNPAGTCSGTAVGNGDTTSLGGNVLLNADGSFTYFPPAAVRNTADSFCYTITGGDTAVVSLNLANTPFIWFVDAAAGVGGNGTQAAPFQEFGGGAGTFEDSAADILGDTIYLKQGSYTGGVTLLPNQKLIGDGSGSTLSAISGVTPVTGSSLPAFTGTAPTLSTGSLTDNLIVSLGGITLRGLNLGDSGGVNGDSSDVTGSTFNTLTLGEMTFSGTGRTLNLTNGTLAMTGSGVLNLTSTASTGGGLSLDTVFGTLTVAGSGATAITTTTAAATGINIVNSSATINLDDTTVTKSGTGAGVNLNANSGTITFNTLNVSTTAGAAVTADTSTSVVVTSNPGGMISAAGGPAINSTGTGWNATFSSVSSSGSATQGVNLNNITGTLNLGGGSITTATGTSFFGQGTLGTTSYAGNITKANAGKIVVLSGAGATTSLTLSGNLTCNSGCTGLDALNRGAGSYAFSGTSKALSTGANAAVTLASNAGATINFTGGGLAITTTSGTGFNATGGGTISVQGNGNTITTTTGSALNVNAATVAAAGLTFQSINSATASANQVISLTNTGAGPVSITGTGGPGTGGTIDNKTDDAIRLSNTSGLITLNQMIIEDIGDMGGASNTISTHDAIHGENVNGGLSMTGTTIRRISDQAIHGATLAGGSATVWNGLTLEGVTIEDSNRFHVANVGDANNEGTIRILGLRGTVTVNNSTFSRGGEFFDTFVTAGTLNMTVTNSSFSNAYKEFTVGALASVGGHCIDVTVQGAGVANVTIGSRAAGPISNAFLNCRLGSLRFVHDAAATGNGDFIVARNTFTVNDGSSGIGGDFDFPMGGVLAWNLGNGAGGSVVDAIVENNTFTDVTNASGGVGQLTLIAEGGLVQGLVQNNSFIRPGNAPWLVQSRNSANSNARMHFLNNTVTGGPSLCTADPSCGGGYNTPGLRTLFDASHGSTMDVTLSGNSFAGHDQVFDPGETVEIRSLNIGAGSAVCTNLENNQADDGYSLETGAGTISTVGAGTCPIGAPSANCQAVLGNRNNRGGANNLLTNPPFVGVIGSPVVVVGGTCPLPNGGPF